MDIIERLAQQEEATAFLYEAFSKTLPEMRAFWEGLVVAEKSHAEVLRKLGEMSRDGSVRLNEKLFNTVAIRTNTEFIVKQALIALEGGVTSLRALSLASDIEHSLAETGCFRTIETERPSINSELDEIHRHTQRHIALVEDQLLKVREQNESREV